MFGGHSPVGGMPDRVIESDAVSEYISSGWEKIYGGKLEFIDSPDEMIRRTLDHIDKKRANLGLAAYDPQQFGKSGDKRMLELETLPIELRREQIYGAAAD